MFNFDKLVKVFYEKKAITTNYLMIRELKIKNFNIFMVFMSFIYEKMKMVKNGRTILNRGLR